MAEARVRFCPGPCHAGELPVLLALFPEACLGAVSPSSNSGTNAQFPPRIQGKGGWGRSGAGQGFSAIGWCGWVGSSAVKEWRDPFSPSLPLDQIGPALSICVGKVQP